jgi:PilZ domain
MAGSFTEARVHPRHMCSIPARMRVADLIVDGEIVDISHGGTKFLPSATAEFFLDEPHRGAEMDLTIAGRALFATIAWISPNFGAIGCAFDGPLSVEDFDAVLMANRLPAGL